MTTTTETRDPRELLRARGVGQRFGPVTALHKVDLDLAEGEFLTVMGPSGSGKSTLLYAVSGMDRPLSGNVQLGGEELMDLSPRQLTRLRLTQMGFVFQQIHLLRDLSLLDNIVLPGFLARREPRERITDRARELMGRMGVADLAERGAHEASGGQLQRVGICRALINRPRILFADEPTGALDSAAAHAVMSRLAEINAEGTSVMMVTHDAQMAAYGRRVVLMGDGAITGELVLGEPSTAHAEERAERAARIVHRLEG